MTQRTGRPAAGPGRAVHNAVRVTLFLLILIIVVFAGIRVVVDWPEIIDGTLPSDDSFELRYVLHPFVGYLHILPGVVYLVGAPFQLSRRFRERHFTLHRRMGRVLLPAGILSGVLGIVFGILFPYGGFLEASASVVFGVYFLTALVTAFVAIKAGDVARHRRWMVRAFAVALAVGTIRIWLGVFEILGVLAIEDNVGAAFFGVAFWLSFPVHALVAEVYLLRWPDVERPANRRTSGGR